MANPLYQSNIVSISDLTPAAIEYLIESAQGIKHGKPKPWLRNRLIASCFFEPSTRTRLSFESAVNRLGGQLIGFADSQHTSAKKGETLADTMRMIASYADTIILRHPQEGAARLATEFSSVPVINGGDGANQHPTQTLLDLFSIYECQGRLEGLDIALVGDLKYGRTVHSLMQALSLFKCRFHLVSPDSLAMPDYVLAEMVARGVSFQRVDNLEAVIPQVDILYMTRVQKERFEPTEYIYMVSDYILRAEALKQARPNLKVLHPLPRVDEIEVAVDQTPHAYYFAQAENGVYARMALLASILNEDLRYE